jgi:acetyl-CoA synthetase
MTVATEIDGSVGTPFPAILKCEPPRVAPNMPDYDAACAGFTWGAARARLDGLPCGGLNIAYEAVDRHAAGARATHVALRCLARDGTRRDLTYADLADQTNRFANVLTGLGIEPGDRVFTLLGRVPELFVAVLGTLKHRSVACPLFSAFGPEPVRERLALGGGRVIITTPELYRRKVAPVRERLPDLAHVLLVGDDPGAEVPGAVDLRAALDAASPVYELRPNDPETLALLHFTSGTTGRPKGAMHVHRAVVAHHATGLFALDLHPDDVFWCTADPGWVTGTSYGIISPLTHGVTSIVLEAEFDAALWYRTLAQEGVTVWYTAPTAIRRLMRAGADEARRHDLHALRFVASVGEPLNPEAVVWGVDALGLAIHDNWWQTETGGIMIANVASAEVRPGSMGRPLPGVHAAVGRRDDQGELLLDHGRPVLVDDPDEPGELLLRAGWPSMFRGYLDDPDRYRAAFTGPWYRTGDLVRRDADGFFWFVGRGDDVIKSAGHLIGPFEVESALLEHPAVAEAGVIGVPDPLMGERVKAFVLLKPGAEPGNALRRELLALARTRLGPAVAPREIAFADTLPHTRSGKIMRRLLRAREVGGPEGDLSTLERDP